MELPSMSEALLEEKAVWNEWGPVVNLDIFFSNMYSFFYNRGLLSIIVAQICTIISTGFTLIFSVFLIAYVDWGVLMQCHDELSCVHVDSYIRPHPFSGVGGVFILFYTILFSAYWIWRSIRAVQIIFDAISMEKFYRKKLGIFQSELDTIRWHEVVERLIRRHEQGLHRVTIQDRLTEHDVVSRILRKENYVIALINKSTLNLKLPWWASVLFGNGDKIYLTKSIEWSIHLCILNFMFDDQFGVCHKFLRDVTGLQNRFRIAGLVHLLLLPFMLLFMTVNFFLQNAQQFHSSKSYLGPRTWSPLALWTFREFNELPHIFESRINASIEPAGLYLASFHSPITLSLAKLITYISGSLVAILLLCSLLGDGILLYVRVGDYNLLWCLGIFSATFAGARALIPDDSLRTVSQEELFNKIAMHTHHFPEDFQGTAHTIKARDYVSELFPFKVWLFLLELMSIVLAPIILIFSLPQSAAKILDFIKERSVFIDGLGSVCDYCRFNLHQHGDVRFGSEVTGHAPARSRPEGPKLEQSLLSFSIHHPHWKPEGSSGGGGSSSMGAGGASSNGAGEGAEKFLTRLHSFKSNKIAETESVIADALSQSTGGGAGANTSRFTSTSAMSTSAYSESFGESVAGGVSESQIASAGAGLRASGNRSYRKDGDENIATNLNVSTYENIESESQLTTTGSFESKEAHDNNIIHYDRQQFTLTLTPTKNKSLYGTRVVEGNEEDDEEVEGLGERDAEGLIESTFHSQNDSRLSSSDMSVGADRDSNPFAPSARIEGRGSGGGGGSAVLTNSSSNPRTTYQRHVPSSLLSVSGIGQPSPSTGLSASPMLGNYTNPHRNSVFLEESVAMTSSIASVPSMNQSGSQMYSTLQGRPGHGHGQGNRYWSGQESILGGPAKGVMSILRSVLKSEEIDFDNDFYWHQKFLHDRAVDPHALEESIRK